MSYEGVFRSLTLFSEYDRLIRQGGQSATLSFHRKTKAGLRHQRHNGRAGLKEQGHLIHAQGIRLASALA